MKDPITKKRSAELNDLQRVLRSRFTSKEILQRALTHRSYVNEVPYPVQENERLEYLGDSVLGLIVNEYLFKRFSEYHEGDLAKIKSTVVSEAILAKVAEELDLGRYILLGRGEENSGGRVRPSILANTVEAIIGAMYLDCGMKHAKQFVLANLKKYIDSVDKLPTMSDPKTSLQELVQKKYKKKPEYRLLSESGPDHQKAFVVGLYINNALVSEGRGTSKRRAETDAARIVLQKIHSEKYSV